MFYAFCQKVIARGSNTVGKNKQTEKSPLQLLSKRNKRICVLVLGEVQWRGVAAVGAVTGGKFRAIIFKCKVPNLNSQRANIKVFE